MHRFIFGLFVLIGSLSLHSAASAAGDDIAPVSQEAASDKAEKTVAAQSQGSEIQVAGSVPQEKTISEQLQEMHTSIRTLHTEVMKSLDHLGTRVAFIEKKVGIKDTAKKVSVPEVVSTNTVNKNSVPVFEVPIRETDREVPYLFLHMTTSCIVNGKFYEARHIYEMHFMPVYSYLLKKDLANGMGTS